MIAPLISSMDFTVARTLVSSEASTTVASSFSSACCVSFQRGAFRSSSTTSVGAVVVPSRRTRVMSELSAPSQSSLTCSRAMENR